MRTSDFAADVIAGQLTETLRAANRELHGFLSLAKRLADSPDPESLARMATRLAEFGTLLERAGISIERGAYRPDSNYARELLDYGRNLEVLQAILSDCNQRLLAQRDDLQAQLSQADAAASFQGTLRNTL